MNIVSRRSASGLNPNAPKFVPQAYRTVEDFSDQWWDLIQSSPCFRDYWLRECFQDPQTDLLFTDLYDDAILPDDIDSFFLDQEDDDLVDDLLPLGQVEERRMVKFGGLARWSERFASEPPKYADKAPKIVNVKVSPRRIQQPS